MRRPSDVAPGEWAAKIIYFCPIKKTVIDEAMGEEVEENYFVMKQYSVYSVDQIEYGCLDHLRVKDDAPINGNFMDFAPAERAISATEASIKYHGDRAFYRRDMAEIVMPAKSKFPNEADFYSVAFHELAHWSEKRTEWEADYATSELRSEIASSYILAELQVPQSSDLTANHQAYVKSWLKALRNDNKYIFKASTAASKAADFILAFSKQPEPDLVEVPF